MFNNKIVYFAEEPILGALKQAFGALWDSVSSERAIEFEKNVKLFSYENHEFLDNEIHVDCSNLQEVVQNWIEQLDIVDITEEFITQNDIRNKIDEFVKTEERTKDSLYFPIEFVNGSNNEMLFNILYARNCFIREDVLEFEDFDYEPIFDKINEIFEEFDEKIESWNWSHDGGDSWDNKTSLDMYFDVQFK